MICRLRRLLTAILSRACSRTTSWLWGVSAEVSPVIHTSEIHYAPVRLLILFVTLAVSANAFAQFPENARMKAHGQGWECNRGFRQVKGQCAKVSPPENAKLDYTGHSWECERGFVRHGNSCAHVDVPANASLDYTGRRWKCNRGFRRDGSICSQIVLPQNANLDYTGNSWKCDRGYRRMAESCVTIAIPEHAALNHAGDAWECERGYRRSGPSCMKISIPANAALAFDGKNWTCIDGHLRRGSECISATQASDAEIRQYLINSSIAGYPGRCPCPYFADRAGRSCGRRSAWSRPGGYSPLCYPTDVSNEQVSNFRRSHGRAN